MLSTGPKQSQSQQRTWAARSLKLNWLRSCFRPVSAGGGAAVAAGPSGVPRRSACS